MLRKRIIFTLVYSDGYFMQSRNFRLQKVGNLIWLEKYYQFQKIAFSIDELIVVNATRNKKSITEFANVITNLVKDVFIPITAGGGIKSMDDAKLLFNSGADKIVVNSILYNDTELVDNLVYKYGSQSIVGSVDYKKLNNCNSVFIKDGSYVIPMTLESYIKHLEELNIGEVYLNSIDKDGTGFGYDLDVISQLSKYITKPLIIAGGAGNELHLKEGLKINGVSAVATANLFNFVGDGLIKARESLIKIGFALPLWDFEQAERQK